MNENTMIETTIIAEIRDKKLVDKEESKDGGYEQKVREREERVREIKKSWPEKKKKEIKRGEGGQLDSIRRKEMWIKNG